MHFLLLSYIFLNSRIFENEYGEETLDIYNQMLNEIDALKQAILEEWHSTVRDQIAFGMQQTLLKKDDKGELSVNFTQELMDALKDIKVLRIMECEVADELVEFYERNEEFWVNNIIL